jgi:pyruvate/2-oxoglutarate dehydrogenase complex dihydrolipoamide acyltransferase (E2) component
LRAFVRYLVAICIGVAGTLAWQAYGEDAKQVIATKAPELGWSPEVRQTIATWTKPLAGPENTAARPPVQETQQPVAQTAPEAVAPAPAAPSFDPEQAKQMVESLDELRQTVGRLAATHEQPEKAKQLAESLDELRQTVGRLAATQEQIASHLAATQEQIGREMTRLQEILAKIPAAPAPPAAPTRKPPSVPPPASTNRLADAPPIEVAHFCFHRRRPDVPPGDIISSHHLLYRYSSRPQCVSCPPAETGYESDR